MLLQLSGAGSEYESDRENAGWSNLDNPWSYPGENILSDGDDDEEEDGEDHEQQLAGSGEEGGGPAETESLARAHVHDLPSTDHTANISWPTTQVGISGFDSKLEVGGGNWLFELYHQRSQSGRPSRHDIRQCLILQMLKGFQPFLLMLHPGTDYD